MNKRLRSRVLAASMVSTTLLGAGGILAPQALMAQDKPPAAELLARGQKLYDQKNYGEAKRILLDIDPAQLPEDLRAQRADLIKNADVELAKVAGPNAKFDAAQADMDAGKLAAAASGFQAIIDDAAAPADVKAKAKIQLALVKEQQAAKAPQMKELLKQADELYKAGKLDDAQNALTTIAATGSDLGWQDREKPAALQAKINEARTAMARTTTPTPATPTTVATTPVTPPTPATPDPVVTTPTPVPAVVPATPAATPSTDSLLGQQALADQVFRERALNDYNLRMDAAARALTLSPANYDAAITNAQDALTIVEANKRYFSETESAGLRDRAQAQLSKAQNEKVVFDKVQKDRATAEAERIERERKAKVKKDREMRVASLMTQAKRFIDTQQLKEAADLYRQVLVIEPTNDTAKLLLQFTTDRINYREWQRLSNVRSEQIQRQTVDSQEHLIPYVDLLVYPGDWVELTRNRAGDQSNADSPQNRVVRERLEESLKEIAADQQGFEKVINFLRDNTNTNIFVNWNALQAAGIDKNTPVSVSLREIPFRKALQTVLSEVGGGTATGGSALGYTIDDGVITISTRDDLNSTKYQVIRVFDIRDMLVQPDTTTRPPTFNLDDITKGGSTTGGTGGGGSTGGGSSLFTEDTGSGSGSGQKSRDDIVKEIVDTIQTTVARDTWAASGGTIGTIRELNGQLIVNQTVDNQTAVYNLLQQLRETRALQIAIESRILLVTNNFFDQLGFDWDLTMTNPLCPDLANLSINNGGSAAVARPTATGVPGSLTQFIPGAPGVMNINAGFILDNFNLNIILSAVQADSRAITVDSPRVTLFNGQRGYIAVTEQQNFVSNFNQTVSSGSGLGGFATTGTNLQVSTLTTGVVLFVEATVSADRRYVVMKAKPQLSQLTGLDTFSSNGVQNPTLSTASGFVQLPRIRYTTVDTMVSVPDGGTLLIGGEKIIGESEIEIGVPVLSKIPGLQRAFTNRAINKDERTLLILMRPKIIIQKEIETNLFGPGYDKPTGLPNPNIGAGYYSNSTGPGFSIGGR